MLIRVYLHKKLYIVTLLDEEGAFVTSSGHYQLKDVYGFLHRCRSQYDCKINMDYLGELAEKLPPIAKVSKLLTGE